jgi:hypothetical protein
MQNSSHITFFIPRSDFDQHWLQSPLLTGELIVSFTPSALSVCHTASLQPAPPVLHHTTAFTEHQLWVRSRAHCISCTHAFFLLCLRLVMPRVYRRMCHCDQAVCHLWPAWYGPWFWSVNLFLTKSIKLGLEIFLRTLHRIRM